LKHLGKILRIDFNKAVVLFISALVEKVVFFAFFICLARNISVSRYGLITAVFTFGNILHSFFEFGFGNYLQREYSFKKENISGEFQTILTFRLIIYILFQTIILAYFAITSQINFLSLILIGLTLYTMGTTSIINRVFYSQDRYRDTLKILLVSRTVFILPIITMAVFHFNLFFILLLFALSPVMQLIWLFKENITLSFAIKFDKKILKNILVAAIPMGLGASFVMVYDKFDVVIIQNILNLEAVGIYSVAYSIYKLPHFLSGTIIMPAYTNFSRSFSERKSVKKVEVIRIVLVLAILSAVMMLFIFVAGGYMIFRFYGSAYFSSTKYLYVLLIAMPGLFFNNFTGVILNSAQKQVSAMNSTLIATVANILINIVFIARYGIIAAVWATIISEYLLLFVQLFFIKKYKIIE
jgi:O-antigen/teichoic acid export membrane protein